MESGTRGSILTSCTDGIVCRRFQELYAKWKLDGTPVNALDYSIETPVNCVFLCFYGRIGPFMEPRSRDSTLWMREKRKESLRKCLEILKFEQRLFVKIFVILFDCDMPSFEVEYTVRIEP